MAVKRKPRGADPLRSLRDHLVELLEGGHAHVSFEDGIADLPPQLRGTKPSGQPFTPWRLLEHIRISQWDIVEFTQSARHVSPEWPAGYWPASDAPPDAAAWDKSAAQRVPFSPEPASSSRSTSPAVARRSTSRWTRPARRFNGACGMRCALSRTGRR